MKMSLKVTLFFVVALFVFAHSASAQTQIYLGNIDERVSEDQLADMFRKFGDDVEVTIVRDKVTGKSKGFGYVKMANAEEAAAAISALNGTDVNNKALIVTEAKARQENAPSGFGNQIPCEGGKLILVQGKFGSVRKCVKDPVPPANPADKSNESQAPKAPEPVQTPTARELAPQPKTPEPTAEPNAAADEEMDTILEDADISSVDEEEEEEEESSDDSSAADEQSSNEVADPEQGGDVSNDSFDETATEENSADASEEEATDEEAENEGGDASSECNDEDDDPNNDCE